MTKIEFSEIDEKIVKFLIKGHTNSSEYGTDIVCASISSTSIMTLNALIEVLGVKDIEYEMKDGYMLCNLAKISKEDLIKSQDFLNSFKLFSKQVAKDYPKNVQFKVWRYGKWY